MTNTISAGPTTEVERLAQQLYYSMQQPGLNPQNVFLLLETLLEREFPGDDDDTSRRFVRFVKGARPNGLALDPGQLTKIVTDLKHPHECPPYNDPKTVERTNWMRRRVTDLLTEPIAKHGANQHTSGGDNITSSDRGTSSAYLRSKLKRDAPEIASRLASGEFRSVRAAARAAGFKVDISPLVELRRAWKRASGEERAEFLAWTSVCSW